MDPSALPGTCCVPHLWVRNGQAVYWGPSLALEPHSGSVSCLAVAVSGTLRVRVAGISGPPVRSVLIPPRLTHQVLADADRLAFCYMDPGTGSYQSCRQAMTVTAGALRYHHEHEAALDLLAEELSGVEQASAWLDLAGGATGTAADEVDSGRLRTDTRIRRVMTALDALPPTDDAPAARMAAMVDLSTSRFLHLFRDQTGTSYRRYRLWLRMLRAADLLRQGHNLTRAATEAGFSSPSHFSDTFHAMFGLRPRQLLGTRIGLVHPEP